MSKTKPNYAHSPSAPLLGALGGNGWDGKKRLASEEQLASSAIFALLAKSPGNFFGFPLCDAGLFFQVGEWHDDAVKRRDRCWIQLEALELLDQV
jgi:hypothetical protein